MNEEDTRREEIKGLKTEVEHWTEKMEQLHKEKIVLRQVARALQKEHKAINHPDMITIRKLCQDKEEEFEACNKQLIAIIDLLEEKQKC